MKARISLRYTSILKWGIITLPLTLALSCNRAGPNGAGAEQFAPAVTVVAAVSRSVPIYLDEIGRTSAAETVTIQPQVTGEVTAIHFTDGAFVKKGQLLYSIDPRPFQADLDRAKAQLTQNQAQYKFAQADFARVEKLKGTQAISQEDYDTKENAVAVAAAQITSAQAAVETAQLNLQYCQIHSPINGRTGLHLIDVGNIASAGGQNGGTSMLVITRIDPIFADFTVTENDLATVQKYMRLAHESKQQLQVLVDTPNAVNIVEEALSSGSAAPTTQTTSQRKGTLEFLNNVVQDGTGTVKLRAAVPNSDHHFWPGQYVSIRLILTVDKHAVLIPSEAIQISQTGPYVFVISPEGTAVQRPISAGQRQGDLVVINKGVHAGEQVVLTGQMLLQPGGKVRIVPSGATTQPASRPTTQSDNASTRSDAVNPGVHA